MHDDFSALDLLSMGGFRLSSLPPERAGKKKRFIRNRRPAVVSAKRGLTAILPMLGARMQRFGKGSRLQGWPVALSWPTREFTTPDLMQDTLERPSPRA
ncbi:MAG: hypothetical protein F8N37_13165 [Telmatospirillum sp.]|nr:hypothetical protein [Telmatospirillum sp.]